jgi:ADP-ribose pyrophosphatase YjhB (NUDIX family)
MRLPVQVRRTAMRVAYAGLRTYWFVLRPRVVGVKCVLTHENDVLLVRHTYGNRAWDLPGGTVRRRELPRHAAEREMHEELGRRIPDWISLGELFVNADHHDDNLHLFQARVQDRELDLNSTELAQAAWFPRDDLPTDLSRYVRSIVGRTSPVSEP